MMVIIFTGN